MKIWQALCMAVLPVVALAQEKAMTRATLGDIRVGHVYDLTTLPVAVREVRNLIQAPAAVGAAARSREGNDS